MLVDHILAGEGISNLDPDLARWGDRSPADYFIWPGLMVAMWLQPILSNVKAQRDLKQAFEVKGKIGGPETIRTSGLCLRRAGRSYC